MFNLAVETVIKYGICSSKLLRKTRCLVSLFSRGEVTWLVRKEYNQTNILK